MVLLTCLENSTVILCKEILLVHSNGFDQVEEIEPPELVPQEDTDTKQDKKAQTPTTDDVVRENLGESMNDDSIPEMKKNNFVCACISKCGVFVAATSDDKKLTLWSRNSVSGKWNFLTTREVIRKCICMHFTSSGRSIVVASRGGDVYDFSVVLPHQKGSLLLGHISMLLDLLITPDDKYVITCDRDDKIRISHYPNAYNILTFCLGHTKFITSLCLGGTQQSWLISGSGDGTIRIWSYRDGIQLYCHTYAQDTEKLTENGAVQRLRSSTDGQSVAAMFLGCSYLNLYTVGEGPTLTHTQTITFPVEPWDIQFDKDNYLVTLVATDHLISLDIYEKDEKDITQCKQINVKETVYHSLVNHISQHSDLHKKIAREERRDFSLLQKQWFDNVQLYLDNKRKRQEEKKTHKKLIVQQ